MSFVALMENRQKEKGRGQYLVRGNCRNTGHREASGIPQCLSHEQGWTWVKGVGGGLLELLDQEAPRLISSTFPPRGPHTHIPALPAFGAAPRRQVNQQDDKCLELHLRKGSQGEHQPCLCLSIQGWTKSLKVSLCQLQALVLSNPLSTEE